MTTLQGKSGKSYTLAGVVNNGKGGEGCVYNVQGRRNIVAKIYHDNTPASKLSLLEKKLSVMIRDAEAGYFDPCVNGWMCFAWPLDTLYSNGKFVGFTMTKAKNTYEFHEIMWSDRQTQFSQYNYDRSIAVAYNLAQAVYYCHTKGYMVGDFNIKNFRFDKKCHVIFLDTDSFGVTDKKTGAHYQTCAGHPEFLAPELQGVRLDGPRAKFSKESDYFSMAIIIFMLLASGANPFNATRVESETDYRSSAADNGTMLAIANGQCPYVRPECGLEISPHAPSMDMFPAQLRELFYRSFYYTRSTSRQHIADRATAEEFCRALYAFLERSKNTCRKDPRHLYLSRLKECPFCAAQKRTDDLFRIINAGGTPAVQAPKPVPCAPGAIASVSTTACSSNCKKGFFARLKEKFTSFLHAIR